MISNLQDLMCYALGDPHYVQYDGAIVDFQDVGWFVMSQRGDRTGCQGLQDFQVLVEQEHRGSNTAVSYVRSIVLIFPGSVTIILRPNRTLTVVSACLMLTVIYGLVLR